MKPSLKIDFVSDIACPWCAIGLSSLLLALERTRDIANADIELHPFELNPDMGPEGEPAVAYLSRKYGRTPDQIAETQRMIRERGASVGFAFGAREHVYNTFDAHRLLLWARDQQKTVPLKLALLRAYHGEGKDMSNREVLVEAAASVGLDPAAAQAVLAQGEFADAVRREEQQYQAMGIRSVPAILFNDRYLISGGQPVEAFEQAIRDIVAEMNGGAAIATQDDPA